MACKESHAMKTLLSTAGLACLAQLAIAAQSSECKVAGERAAASPLAGIKSVQIDAEAGDLHINGVPNAASIDARGKACASDEKMMEEMKLEVVLKGTVLHVSAKTPGGSVFHVFGRSSYATLDLTLTLPADLPVTVADTSGNLEVAGVLDLDLKDGPGDILVHDIARNVVIDDDSGDLVVTDVTGNVTLKDGSGDIKVQRVGGKVEVTSDGSGDIEVEDVAHGFTVLVDGSGEISFSRVHGVIEIPARNH
jgi:Putative adhesin